MGRYYNGDIEGKFWFGVQSSTDADFFGVDGEPRFYNYYFVKENLPKVVEGLRECRDILGDNKKILDDFFNQNNGYNDDMLIKLGTLKNVDGSKVSTDEQVRDVLTWYARYKLGKQIHERLHEKGYCNFEAEL